MEIQEYTTYFYPFKNGMITEQRSNDVIVNIIIDLYNNGETITLGNTQELLDLLEAMKNMLEHK